MNYAILVGINSYKQVSGLNGCLNDIEDVAERLSSTGTVPAANIIQLIDTAATKVAIVSAVEATMKKLTFGERAYLHFSCHGAQLPTSDTEEPDGVDEVLCAHDFDWTASTAIADDELYRLLMERSPGSEVLVTIDCCHSGDQVRAVLSAQGDKVRTLKPPSHVQVEIARRSGTVHALRSISRGLGIGFVSACSPWQFAADTAFDGRPNGAFSYYFLREELARPAATLDDLCASLIAPLAKYNMTPVVEGHASLVWRAVGSRSLKRLADDASRVAPLARGSQVLLERRFEATLAGQRVALELRIAVDNGQVVVFPSASVFGAPIAVPPVVLSGNQQVEVPLGGMLGIRLLIGVSGWVVAPDSIRFDLDLSLGTGMWFVPSVHLGRLPVSLRPSQIARSAIRELATPADLVALLTLQGASHIGTTEPVLAPAGLAGSRHTIESISRPREAVRSRGSASIEFNYFECIRAEAAFGDTIQIIFRGEVVKTFIANTNGYEEIRQSRALPDGGADLQVVQFYFGQARQLQLSRRIDPSDGPGEVTYEMKAGDDRDPGGHYRFSIRLA